METTPAPDAPKTRKERADKGTTRPKKPAKAFAILPVKMDADLHKRFMEFCGQIDRPAAQVLRDFIRKTINQHQQGKLDL